MCGVVFYSLLFLSDIITEIFPGPVYSRENGREEKGWQVEKELRAEHLWRRSCASPADAA